MSLITPEAVNVAVAPHGTGHGDILSFVPGISEFLAQNPGVNLEMITIAGQDLHNVISDYGITHLQTFGELFHGMEDVQLNTPKGMTEAIKLNTTYLAPGMVATMLDLLVKSRIEGKEPVLVANQPMVIPTLPLIEAFIDNTRNSGGGLVVADFNTILPDQEFTQNSFDQGIVSQFKKVGSQMKNDLFGTIFKGVDWWYGVNDHLKNVSEKAFHLVLDYLQDPENEVLRGQLARFGIENSAGIKIDRLFDLRHLEHIAESLSDPASQELLTEISQNRANWVSSIWESTFKMPENAYRIYATNKPNEEMKQLSDKVITIEPIKYEEQRDLYDEERMFLNEAQKQGKDVVVISFSSQPHLPEGITKENQKELTWLLEEAAKELEDLDVSLFYVNSMEYDLDEVDPGSQSNLFISKGRVPLGKVLKHDGVMGGVHHAGQGSIGTFDEAGKWSVAIPSTVEQQLNRKLMANPASPEEFDMAQMLKDKTSFVEVITKAVNEVLTKRHERAESKASGGSAQLAEALNRIIGRIISGKRD